ncbi:MAG: hypothetical protein ACRERX_23515 [Pseudomonas sp.]
MFITSPYGTSLGRASRMSPVGVFGNHVWVVIPALCPGELIRLELGKQRIFLVLCHQPMQRRFEVLGDLY